MPLTETTTINIICDNSECPGNTLDPTNRDGWLFISNQISGASYDHVYCSYTCVNTITSDPTTARQHGFAME